MKHMTNGSEGSNTGLALYLTPVVHTLFCLRTLRRTGLSCLMYSFTNAEPIANRNNSYLRNRFKYHLPIQTNMLIDVSTLMYFLLNRTLQSVNHPQSVRFNCLNRNFAIDGITKLVITTAAERDATPTKTSCIA